MQQQIVHLLKKNPGYLSGEEISRSLKMSRAGIWKYMQELRKEGYEILAVPHLGYKLISSPDKLLPQEIQFQLRTKTLGKKIIYEETVSSTMDAAFNLGLEGAEEGTIVCAESQTKGRGRLGRAWSSPKGQGIYMSVILRPSWPPSEVARVTLLSAVVVAQAVKNIAGVPALIKWPNDVLIHHKKLAGILTELSAEMDRVKFVVVGIGLNVNANLSQLPPGATSLKVEAKRPFSRIEVIQEILREFEKWYVRLDGEGFAPVRERFRELSVTLKKRIRVSDSAGSMEGEAIDIDYDGGLLIRQDSGVIVKRMAGDVLEVR